MRPALVASLLVLTFVLGACGEPQSTASKAPPAPVDTTLTQAPVDATPIQPEPTPVPSPAPAATPRPKPEPVIVEPVPEPVPEPGSCLAEIGETRAKALVERCIQVSPATRPPCNVANPCELIQSEIDRSCALWSRDGETPPKACAA